METMEAIKIRHSVRRYTDRKIDGDILTELKRFIESCNGESGLNMQLCLDKPEAFKNILAKYGSFQNVNNYIGIVGDKKVKLAEKCGYYGEKVVIKATELGLQTCWVGGTYSKGKCACDVAKGEKIYCVITIGYGVTPGADRKTKTMEELCSSSEEMLGWFIKGVQSAMLAPTAMNQQKFHFELKDGKVKATTTKGFYADLDLGIAKYHFELASGYKFNE